MSEEAPPQNEKPDRFLVGPGFGFFIMGVTYLVWWIIFSPEYIFGPPPLGDPRWAHNWAYAIIIMTIGAAWYQKSAISRGVAAVQAFMLPVTASGSFNTFLMTYITVAIIIIWGLIVMTEKLRGKRFLQDRLSPKTWEWICMHALIIAWLLVAHMGLVFLIGRVPLEHQLLNLDKYAGYLANLPPEIIDLATWAFDITLIIWAIIVLYDQFKLGYNIKNKPFPRRSFWWVFVCMGSSLVALAIQAIIS